MPFTLAHPAVVLPFARRPLVPAALLAGSIAPDVLFYLWPATDDERLTHTPLGAVTVDIALAVALVVAAQLLRWPVLSLLPGRLRGALAGPARRGFAVRSVRRGCWWLVSAAVGTLSHLCWDAFTHADGAAVHLLPWLAVTRIDGMPVYAALQWLSSVAGLIVVTVALVWWVRRLPVSEPPARRWPSAMFRHLTWLAVGLVVVTGALLRCRGQWGYGAGAVIPDALFGAGAAAALALAGYGLAWHAVDRRPAR